MISQFQSDESHRDELFLVQRLNTAPIIFHVRIFHHFLHQFPARDQILVGQVQILRDIGLQRSNLGQGILKTECSKGGLDEDSIYLLDAHTEIISIFDLRNHQLNPQFDNGDLEEEDLRHDTRAKKKIDRRCRGNGRCRV